MTTYHTTSQTVELWIRSFTPLAAGSNQTRALECLERLDERGAIDAAEVGVWGGEIERSALSKRVPQLEHIQSRLEAFETWARENDRQLEPFFRQRRVESQITGETHDVWRLPTVALAEFDDEGLVHVAPCRDGDRTTDVGDRLEALGAADRAETVVRFDGDHDDRRQVGGTDDAAETTTGRSTTLEPASFGSN